MTVPPPARLSTTSCWPHISDSFWVTTRVMMSVPPPVEYGTMTRTAFTGYATTLSTGCAYTPHAVDVTINTPARRRSLTERIEVISGKDPAEGCAAHCETSTALLFPPGDYAALRLRHWWVSTARALHVQRRLCARQGRPQQRDAKRLSRLFYEIAHH